MGTDGLTGLPRIDALAAALTETPATAVFVDVDGMVWVNAADGVLEGDEVLRANAGCIRDRAVRHRGVAARVGGDEFIVMLPHGTTEEGSQVALDIMSDVDALQIRIGRREGWQCPFDTLGVSTLVFPLTPPMTEDRRRLVENLSYALWEAKTAAGSKDRVAGVVDAVRPAPTR